MEFIKAHTLVHEGSHGIFLSTIPTKHLSRWQFVGDPFINSDGVICWKTERGMLMTYPCGTKRFVNT